MRRATTLTVAFLLLTATIPAPATADHSPTHAIAGDDCHVGFTDVLTGISHYNTNTAPPNASHPPSFADILTLISTYNTDHILDNCTPSTTPSTTGVNVTVIDVVDGDTIEIRYDANNTIATVRLIGVDTPEIHVETNPAEFEGVPDTRGGHDWLGDWGDNASTYLEHRLNGTTVRLTGDANTANRGSFGRLLRYVWLNDSTTVNRLLVDQGYARVYTASDFTNESEYLSLEAAAQAANRGVWGYTNASSSTTQLAVSVHADAAGDEYDNLNDEYVTLTNTGDTPLDLSDWTINDAAGHTYTVPDGVTLAPGESITLHTGSGTDTNTDLYWGQDAPVWNNGGDTVTIRNASGGVVVEKTYS